MSKFNSRHFIQFFNKLNFLMIISTALVFAFLTVDHSFGAGAVYVNAPREKWPQNKLTFGVDLTSRYESLHNFNFTGYGEDVPYGDDDDSIYLGRARVGIDYKFSDKVRFSLWGYEANAWDFSVPDDAFYNPVYDYENSPYDEHGEIYKAFVEIRPVKNFKIKAGRQRLDYGDFRTFGLCNWTMTGPNLWDAIKLAFDFGDNNFIDLFYGGVKMNDPESFSLTHRHICKGGGMYSSFALPVLNARIEPFFSYKGDNDDEYRGEKGGVDELDEYYTGARLWGRDFYNIDYDLWVSKEFGERGPDDIDAYAYHALVGYNFKSLWAKPRFSLEYTYSSGDSDPSDGDHETYDVGYGVWGSWYGHQWSFFKWRNFKDLQSNLEVWPTESMHTILGLHNYWLAEEEDAWYLNKNYRDPEGDSGNKVGEMIDLTTTINLGKIFPDCSLLKGHSISATYGHFFASNEVPENLAHSEDDANWFYIQWNFHHSWKIF